MADPDTGIVHRFPEPKTPHRPALGGYGGPFGPYCFHAPLTDRGDGEVNLILARGLGVATFSRPSAATCRLANGMMKKVVGGVPRSHYLADGTYLGYYRETARTNIALRSEEFNVAPWTLNQATITANAIIAPDGTLTADKLVEAVSVAQQHFVVQGVAIASNTPYVMSLFAKAGERNRFRLTETNTTNFAITVDLNTGIGSALNGAVVTVEPWNDGWYRITVQGTSGAAQVLWNLRIQLESAAGATVYDGDGVSGLYLWGAQLEQASFASSYISTLGATVNRDTDSLSYPGDSNIFTDKGTAYIEVFTTGLAGLTSPMFIRTGDNSGRPVWTIGGTGSENTAYMYDGTTSFNKAGLSSTFTASRKRASSWGNAVMAVTGDGLTPETRAFDGTMGPCTEVEIGENSFFGCIKNVKIFPHQMSDFLLAALTQ